MQAEIILAIGAEGGSIDLVGIKTGGRWKFSIKASDQSWMLDDDDDHTPPTHPWVSTWQEAVVQLDRYPWPQLHPLHVHPEFCELVAENLKEKENLGVTVNWSVWAAKLQLAS